MNLSEKSNCLSQHVDGIWSSHKEVSVSFPDGAHLRCFELENDSFWFEHRNNCITAAMKSFSPSGPVLDIGGGNGFVTRRILDEGFQAVLLEPGKEGAFIARNKRRIPDVICSTLEDARFHPYSWSAICLFDVLEHIEDDRMFIGTISSVLEPGGLLYITVPAHQWLWSMSDVNAGHFRRYCRESLVDLFGGSFELLYFTYYFCLLIFPIMLFRVLPFKLGLKKKKRVLSVQTEHGSGSPSAKRIMNYFLRYEIIRISREARMRFGASCLLVARKRPQ